MEREDRFCGLVSEIAASLGIALSASQVEALTWQFSLLERWRSKINLTSVEGLEDIAYRHFGESLAVASVIGPGGGSVVDVGSGAGFPGVPVAVCWPERPVHLIEAVGKKCTFLKEVTRSLGNVRVVHGRFEDYIGESEWLTMRAVAWVPHVDRMRGAEKLGLLVSQDQLSGLEGAFGRPEIRPLPWDPRRSVFVSRGST